MQINKHINKLILDKNMNIEANDESNNALYIKSLVPSMFIPKNAELPNVDDIANVFADNFTLANRVQTTMKTMIEKANFKLLKFPLFFYDYTNNSEFYTTFFGKLPSSTELPFNENKLNEYSCKRLMLPKENNGKTIYILQTVVDLKKKYGNEMFAMLVPFGIVAIFEFNMMILFISDLGSICAYVFYDFNKRDKMFDVFSTFNILDKTNENTTIQYIVNSSDGEFYTKSLDVSIVDSKNIIEENYNDEIPDKQIIEFLESNDSGIAIFHGEPGTGKTTYIRNLISRINKQFIYLNKETLLKLSQNSMVNFLIDNRDSVIVLEDCEEVISKNNGRNTCLTNLLNMSDGILGDSLKFKFICTFNVSTSEIDPAIMRKGRMKVKYEFKKLSKEKTKKLLEKLYSNEDFSNVSEMTLADIYNYKVDNGNKIKKNNTIGF